MRSVFVSRALSDEALAPLRDRFDVNTWTADFPVPYETLKESIRGVDGLLSMLTDQVDASLLEVAPSLKVVSQMAVGVDNVDTRECELRGILVGHTPGVLTETVADTAMALLGAIVRRIPEGQQSVRDGEWGPWSPDFMTGGDLYGTNLGIIGMGRIGQALARRAVGYNMRILYTSRSSVAPVDSERVPLDNLLRQADHVVLCAALTAKTRGLINSDALTMMKPSAFLVNVSRGPLVVTDDLLTALRDGTIMGAALDVTDPEPLPPSHPLLELSNCLVVPHIGSASKRTRDAMARLAVSNLMAGLDGQPMPARFTPNS